MKHAARQVPNRTDDGSLVVPYGRSIDTPTVPSARVGVTSRKVEARKVPRRGGVGTSEHWPSAKDQDDKLHTRAQPDGSPLLLAKLALHCPHLGPGR